MYFCIKVEHQKLSRNAIPDTDDVTKNLLLLKQFLHLQVIFAEYYIPLR